MDNSGLIADALLRTAPALYAQIDGGNSWETAIQKRGARVKLYRNYERGDHRSDITPQMRNMLRLREDGAELNDFNDNYMRIVIDKMAGRVRATGVKTGDDNIDADWLAETLRRNSFDAAQGMWWRGAIRDGDSFVMIDPDTLLWTNEPSFDQYSGVVVIYDQKTRRPAWACKAWSESDTEDIAGDEADGDVIIRLVVYQPDKISYWFGQDGSDIVEPDPQDEMGGNFRAWPAELGGKLPIVAFANARDNYTMYGESEIRPAVPLQDVLNRLMYSTTASIELNGTPINIAIGISISERGFVPGAIINLVLRDTEGNVITDPTPEQLDLLRAVRVEQLMGADLNQHIAVWDRIAKEISHITQTPIYGVTSDGALSGEALKQLEIGLIGKIERFQMQNIDALRDLVMMTAEMERVFYPGLGTPEIEQVDVLWKPAELLDTDAKIRTLISLRKDAPGLFSDDFMREQIGGLLGVSKEKLESESENATNQSALNFERLVGAGGGVPPVV